MTSIEIINRVTSHLQIAIDADSGLTAMIPVEVQMSVAREGWTGLALNDQQGDLVMWVSLYSLIPRMIQQLMNGISKTQTGPMTTEFEKAIDYLKLLMQTVDKMITRAEKKAAPQDLAEGDKPVFAPTCGIRSF